jgi:aryl-alcohol dehydrogenase-like predicted oxidoreductase
LAIGFVPFSPLGRGFLAGSFSRAGDLPAGDFRHQIPRLDDSNAPTNAGIVDTVREVASRHGTTSATVALAWVLGRGRDIVPIPGTRRRQHLDQNLTAADLELTDADMTMLNGLAERVVGERYTPQHAQLIER